jgi:hypothetical protein
MRYHADRCIEAAELLGHAYDDIEKAFYEILNDLEDRYIMADKEYPYQEEREFPIDSDKLLEQLLESMEMLIDEADVVSRLRIKNTKENINMVMGIKERYLISKRIEQVRSRMYYY